MSISHINGVAVSGVSAIDGISKATLSAINGQGISAPPPIAFVQQAEAESDDVSLGVTASLPAGASADNVLVALIGLKQGTLSATPTFNSNNMTLQASYTATDPKLYIYTMDANAGGTGGTDCVIQGDTADQGSVIICEVSGLSSITDDASSTNNGTSDTPAIASIDPVATNNIVFGALAHKSTYSSGPTNSFVRLTPPSGGTRYVLEGIYRIRAADGAAIDSELTTSGSSAWTALAASFAGN